MGDPGMEHDMTKPVENLEVIETDSTKPESSGGDVDRGKALRVTFATLGCKVNSAETEGMKTLFQQSGYQVVEPDLPADVCVINTCTVTKTGDGKSRQLIRRFRSRNPEAVVVATGCYVQVAPQEAAAVPGVDLVLGNNCKHEIVQRVEALLPSHRLGAPVQVEVLPRREMDRYESLPVSDWTGQTRAFLKVQDGCDRFCSYCIIPYARGPVRSRPVADAVAEAEHLVGKGFSEFVVTGIQLASYQDDKPGMESRKKGDGEGSLLHLLQALEGVAGIRRIRLGSLEPFTLTPEFLDGLRLNTKLCPHFHISLQSGSKTVLQRMNRRYAPDDFLHMLGNIRSRFVDASITTDIMVGFPGETDEEFEQSIQFCKEAGFAWMHVFPYSSRKGTPAALFPQQIDKTVKEARAMRMGQVSGELKAAYAKPFAGRRMELLFEKPDPRKPGILDGFTVNYLPVSVQCDASLAGHYADVRIDRVLGESLYGTLIADSAL